MEAAVCAKKAIALSFAFYSRDHDPDLIAGASRVAVKVIEHLYSNWSPDTDLYSINVPLVPDVETHKIVYTHALQNYWTSGSSFEEVPATEGDQDPESHEAEIRQGEAIDGKSQNQITRHRHRHFKWAPKFGDIQKSIDAAPPGNDGWAIAQGFTSVTPLKANFMHATDVTLGELKLSSDVESSPNFPAKVEEPFLYALINHEDPYVQPLILSAFKKNLAPSSYRLISSPSDLPTPATPLVQITSYETLDFHHLMAHPTTSLANAYIIRKALIRKHWLSHTVSSWLSKHPNSILKDHVKPTPDFELDYAEFLDEALVEAYELHESFARNALLASNEETKKEWWILKPSMSDRGQGIRLFSSEDELRCIFEEWEADAPDSDADEESEPENSPITNTADGTKPGIMTSHLRHFVAQPYISPPLLLPSFQNRKFHIRSYVLCIGALRVYVYEEMLALFAAQPYVPPSSSLDLQIHLTNTCLQASESHDSVHLLSSLPLPEELYISIVDQIATTTGALFEAASRGQMVYFQTLPNAFEIFGVDWLVDAEGKAWLLEVNAFPDFKQSGDEGEGVVRGIWEAAVGIAVRGFFGMEERDADGTLGVREVMDVDLGRR
ncbi:tubulin--tyrosine ligase PBY1 [Physcia stellaris]|nr:tubulin--tyrosine ligase PBY1 [Physcia stellaris]